MQKTKKVIIFLKKEDFDYISVESKKEQMSFSSYITFSLRKLWSSSNKKITLDDALNVIADDIFERINR
jgi:hypothetical protein